MRKAPIILWGRGRRRQNWNCKLKTFDFLDTLKVLIQSNLEVIRGQEKANHWISCCYCIPWVSNFRLICMKPQFIKGHQRSLKVISVQFFFENRLPNYACSQQIGRFDQKIKATLNKTYPQSSLASGRYSEIIFLK